MHVKVSLLLILILQLSKDRIQFQLAKCLLGIPITSPNFVAQVELGFPHFAQSLWTVQLNSFRRWRDHPYERWTKKAMLEHLSGRWHSKYFNYICNIKDTINLPVIQSKNDNKVHLERFFIDKVNDEMYKSNLPAYQPVTSISRGHFVSEDETSALCVGMKVNNCRKNPTQGKDRSRNCPFCPGTRASEFHVTWLCPKMSSIRQNVGITAFKNIMSLSNYREESESYCAYINGFDCDMEYIDYKQFEKRIETLLAVRAAWYSAASIPTN